MKLKLMIMIVGWFLIGFALGNSVVKAQETHQDTKWLLTVYMIVDQAVLKEYTIGLYNSETECRVAGQEHGNIEALNTTRYVRFYDCVQINGEEI